MSPDAPTSPPGGASGLNIFWGLFPDGDFITVWNRPAFAGIYWARQHAKRPTTAFGREKMLRKVLNVLVISSAILTVACNTVRGAGDDLKSASNAVDNTM
jgi:predicted small secreted protein